MITTTSLTKLAPALVKAQKEMSNATKGAKNPFFKSAYADLNSIREAVMPALSANGFALLQPTYNKDGKKYVQTVLLHESGEMYASDGTEVVCAKPNDPQAQGSAISYARRYDLQSTLNVGAVDDDAESATTREVAEKNPENKTTFRKSNGKAPEAAAQKLDEEWT